MTAQGDWCAGPRDCIRIDTPAALLGRTFVVTVSSAFYARQARARGGAPAEGHFSAGLGWYILHNGKLYAREADPPPVTLDDLRHRY